MPGSRLDGVVLRLIRLQDHPPAQQAAARPTRHLRQHLEGALARAEVRQIEADIRTDHADQRHHRQIESLGDHLRADQHVGLAVHEALQDGIVRCLCRGGIGVPAQHARGGKGLHHRLLHLLRAGAEVADALRVAARAQRGLWRGVIAAVAAQHLAVAVVGERGVAARAAHDEAAVPAEHVGGLAAPVEEEDGLFLAGERIAQRAPQRPAEHARVARLKLLAHVDHVDRRQADHQRIVVRRLIARRHVRILRLIADALAVAHDAVGQRQPRDLAQVRAVHRLDIGRGAAEDHHRTVVLRAGLGQMARVVIGRQHRRRVLVTAVVLLVEDDHADILQRGEQRRTRPDDDPHQPVTRAAPRVVALALAQPAVHERHLSGEAPGHAPHRLRGERDLRHEEDRAAPLIERMGDRAQIDLGLAAAGDAVQQKALRLACVEGALHRSEGRPLGAGERGRGGGQEVLIGQRVAVLALFAQPDQLRLLQPAQIVDVCTRLGIHPAHLHRVTRARQHPQHAQRGLGAPQLAQQRRHVLRPHGQHQPILRVDRRDAAPHQRIDVAAGGPAAAQGFAQGQLVFGMLGQNLEQIGGSGRFGDGLGGLLDVARVDGERGGLDDARSHTRRGQHRLPLQHASAHQRIGGGAPRIARERDIELAAAQRAAAGQQRDHRLFQRCARRRFRFGGGKQQAVLGIAVAGEAVRDPQPQAEPDRRELGGAQPTRQRDLSRADDRLRIDAGKDGLGLKGGRGAAQAEHDAIFLRGAERHLHQVARCERAFQRRRHAVIEGLIDRDVERDLCKHAAILAHLSEVRRAMQVLSSRSARP